MQGFAHLIRGDQSSLQASPLSGSNFPSHNNDEKEKEMRDEITKLREHNRLLEEALQNV
jgi:hypothetical protein